MLAFLLLYLSVLMWRKTRPRWSEAESRCAAQLRTASTVHAAKATTEMEQSGIEVRCPIADGFDSARGESHDRDEAKRNRGALPSFSCLLNLQALSVMLKYRTNTEKDAAKEESP